MENSSPMYDCPVCGMRYFNKLAQIQCHSGERMLRVIRTASAIAAVGFVGTIYSIPILHLLGYPVLSPGRSF